MLGCYLSDGWIEKTVLHQNNGAFWALCSTMHVQLNFQSNQIVWKVSFFHSERLSVTNFGIVLYMCIVHVGIFIKIYVVNLFRIIFFIVKDTHNNNFENFEKNYAFFLFFKSDEKNHK